MRKLEEEISNLKKDIIFLYDSQKALLLNQIFWHGD